MKSYALMPLHSFQVKIVGAVISLIAIILLLLVNFIDGLVLIPKPDGMQVDILLWINAMGLFFIAFSKERYEDERVSLVRDRTYRSTLGMMLAVMFAISITDALVRPQSQAVHPIQVFPTMLIITLIYHLIIFYFRLYSNVNMDVEEQTVVQNVKNNRLLYIIFLTINVIALLILLII